MLEIILTLLQNERLGECMYMSSICAPCDIAFCLLVVLQYAVRVLQHVKCISRVLGSELVDGALYS